MGNVLNKSSHPPKSKTSQIKAQMSAALLAPFSFRDIDLPETLDRKDIITQLIRSRNQLLRTSIT